MSKIKKVMIEDQMTKYAIVPQEPTEEMERAGISTFSIKLIVAKAIAARPPLDAEMLAALELARRWKDIHTDESYGPQGKNLGILARALLRAAGELE